MIYLLRHLGGFRAHDPKHCPLSAGMRIAENTLGLKTWRVSTGNKVVPQDLRMLFGFERQASDEEAHEVAESCTAR